jgi:hypothetical protein
MYRASAGVKEDRLRSNGSSIGFGRVERIQRRRETESLILCRYFSRIKLAGIYIVHGVRLAHTVGYSIETRAKESLYSAQSELNMI